MFKKRMRLVHTYFLRYIVSGAMWLIYGLINVIDRENVISGTAMLVAMIIAFLAILLSIVIPHEAEDEMSRGHFGKACMLTLGLLTFVILVVGIVSEFVPLKLPEFGLLFPFPVGLILVSVGGIFLYQEKAGEIG